MGEPELAFENEHQRPNRPPRLTITPVRRAIRGIIGGLVGAVSSGLGGAVGITVVLAGDFAWEGRSGWLPLIFVCFSVVPMLGGFLGGSFMGAMGARAGGSAVGLTLGGVLGAWFEFIMVILLTWYSKVHDLIGYPTAFVYLLFILSGVLPPIVISVLGFRFVSRIHAPDRTTA